MQQQCPVCESLVPANAATCPGCGVAATHEGGAHGATLPHGAELAEGCYTIKRVIGQGGFGITYQARDNRLQRIVCLKEFFPAHCLREGRTVVPFGPFTEDAYANARDRFLEEARILARFRHPGIVEVHSCFEANNTAYMVMEYLQGKTLGDLLRERGRLDEATALGYVKSIGAALEAVHAQHLLHRDIKPDNIMLCDDGRIVLIDFGTARDVISGQTQGHTVAVTPGYAPLEQYAQRAQRGAYTDVYALGATLYHLLTGEVPPAATDRAAGVELNAPVHLFPDISPDINRAVMWAMSISVAERPGTATEFLEALTHSSHALETVAPEPGETLHASGDSRSGPWQAKGYTEDVTDGILSHSSHNNKEVKALQRNTPLNANFSYAVKVSTRVLVWPKLCACCGKANEDSAPVKVASDLHEHDSEEFYCATCRQHVQFKLKLPQHLARVLGGGILAAFILFLWLGPGYTAAIMALVTVLAGLYFSQMRKELTSLTGPECSSEGRSMYWRTSFSFKGRRTYTYVFTNRNYAERFQQLNAPRLYRQPRELDL